MEMASMKIEIHNEDNASFKFSIKGGRFQSLCARLTCVLGNYSIFFAFVLHCEGAVQEGKGKHVGKGRTGLEHHEFLEVLVGLIDTTAYLKIAENNRLQLL